MPRLLVSCGEPSGDLYARRAGAPPPRPTARRWTSSAWAATGWQARRRAAHSPTCATWRWWACWRWSSHLPRLRRVFRDLLAEVDAARPDLAVLVDYPDFNLRLARALHRRGIPVVYYVSPQVWAWRRGPVRAIRETVARMLVIFPFEEAVYREAGVPVTFVGHPLVDLVRAGARPRRVPARPRPRSRRGRWSPCCRAAGPRRSPTTCPRWPAPCAARASGGRTCSSWWPLAPSIDPAPVARRSRGSGARSSRGRRTRSSARRTPASSPRARPPWRPRCSARRWWSSTGCPRLTYRLGRRFVRVPHFAMVNLIAERAVVPELIQADFTPEKVAAEAARPPREPERRERHAARTWPRSAGGSGQPGASGRAAAGWWPRWLARGRKTLTDAGFRATVSRIF